MYDDLDRLETVSSNYEDVMQMDYSPDGTIYGKTGLGYYDYSPL